MANLTLNEYQNKAMSTCMPESDNLFYMLVNYSDNRPYDK